MQLNIRLRFGIPNLINTHLQLNIFDYTKIYQTQIWYGKFN